jgi:ATP-dependent DNA ligase
MADLTPAPAKRSPRRESDSTIKPLPFMKPKPVDAPPAGNDWLHEIKYDGYRTQIIVQNGLARAFTSNHHDWTKQYAPIVSAARDLPCTSAIIDGEVCVQDERRNRIRRAPQCNLHRTASAGVLRLGSAPPQ